jgi:hypothetical protein
MFFGSLATHRTFDFFHFILLGEAAQRLALAVRRVEGAIPFMNTIVH